MKGFRSEKHVVRFEPVGIEIEVDEDQNILRAAAEQGIMLMHGCKEGQCASCKSFVLEGDDIEHDKYSTFALPDFELEEATRCSAGRTPTKTSPSSCCTTTRT